MTILVDWQIKKLIDSGEIKVDPYDESLINPNSLDIRLGNKFGEVNPTGSMLLTSVKNVSVVLNGDNLGSDIVKGYKTSQGFNDKVIDPQVVSSFTTDLIESDKYVIGPRSFVLGCLLENITLPNYICATIKGKSSLGRLGLENSSPAGHVDSSWTGVLTIELFNYSKYPIVLTAGMKIGQMLFHQGEPVEFGYGSKSGRYLNQYPGQGSKGV